MTNEQYATMCQKIITNTSWYKPISKGVIEKFNDTFYDLVDGAFCNGAIDKDIWEFVITSHPRIPTLLSP